MNRFSRALGLKVERDVVDRTGLAGTYSFTLRWQLENRPDANPSWVQPESGPANSLFLPSIFTALREQLGLKLKAARGPGEALVIDQVEKPSPN
jgi:uncharacterized protein (TIGR03435 family)